jgi:hypothetical protein
MFTVKLGESQVRKLVEPVICPVCPLKFHDLLLGSVFPAQSYHGKPTAAHGLCGGSNLPSRTWAVSFVSWGCTQ